MTGRTGAGRAAAGRRVATSLAACAILDLPVERVMAVRP
jgi:hypothetical protein